MKTIDNIVIVGFGSIAQALIPLLVERYECKITIFEKDIDFEKEKIAREFQAIIVNRTITQHNLRTLISPHLSKTTFLLNLAVSVSSEALIELAQLFEALYLDTCIEPWEYLSEDDSSLTSNFHLRESLKKFSTAQKINGSTSIVAHGANPGFISVLLKKALVTMAHLNKIEFFPVNHQDWAILAKKLGIRVVQISERDTQISSAERPSAHFVCTWSVDGLITECLQPAEMGWGSH